MKTALLFLAIMLIAFVVAIAAAGKSKGQRSKEKPRRKRLVTPREEAMFNRLQTALPEHRVLTQVSMGALLTAKSRGARNTFDRKIVDFVICKKSLEVVAVIELDDASHKTKEAADSARDALLEGAGYRVIRYKNVPDIDQVQRDFTPPTESEGALHANDNEFTGASTVNAAGTVLAREAEAQQKRTAQRAPARAHQPSDRRGIS